LGYSSKRIEARNGEIWKVAVRIMGKPCGAGFFENFLSLQAMDVMAYFNEPMNTPAWWLHTVQKVLLEKI